MNEVFFKVVGMDVDAYSKDALLKSLLDGKLCFKFLYNIVFKAIVHSTLFLEVTCLRA